MVSRAKAPTVTTGDPIEMLETQMMILFRNLTLLNEQHQRDWGMDRAGYLLLRTLEVIGPASINTLAGTLGLDGSTVTRQVAAMQESGMIERATDPRDRRCSIIQPTDTGLTEMTRYRKLRRKNVAKLTEGWSAHERRTLSKMLGRLNDAIATFGADDEIPPRSRRRRRARGRRFRTA